MEDWCGKCETKWNEKCHWCGTSDTTVEWNIVPYTNFEFAYLCAKCARWASENPPNLSDPI